MSRTEMLLRNKDVLSGLLFLVIAAIFGFGARNLPIGTSLRMGPGYFPLVLSGGLAMLGVLVLLGGLRAASEADAVGSFAWGRTVVISVSVLVFVFGLSRIGLPLSIFLTVLIASAASRSFRLAPCLALAAGASVASWIIFAELLGLPFQLTGSWLGL